MFPRTQIVEAALTSPCQCRVLGWLGRTDDMPLATICFWDRCRVVAPDRRACRFQIWRSSKLFLPSAPLRANALHSREYPQLAARSVSSLGLVFQATPYPTCMFFLDAESY